MSIKSEHIASVPSVQVHVAGNGTSLGDGSLDGAIDNADDFLER